MIRTGSTPPRVLYFGTVDWHFLSHRRALAEAARQAGYEVWVATSLSPEHGERLRATGFSIAPLEVSRSGLGPIAELRSIAEVVRILRRVRPALIHNIALKPVAYGSLASRLAGTPGVVNAMTGMGFLFSNRSFLARALRPVVLPTLGLLWRRRGVRVIVQNQDDQALLRGTAPSGGLRLIRGSGVDVEHFRPLPEPEGPITLGLVARMLRDKGISELVEALTRLRDAGTPVRALLAGPVDPDNRTSYSEAEVRSWEAAGLVEWLGEVKDVRDVWRRAHIAVLPSYREGLPKSLLEAAACGRAMVAADVPGCREICVEGVTGLRAPVRTSAELAEAIARLAGDTDLRRAMAVNARRLVEEELSQEVVNRQTLELYGELLREVGQQPPGGPE